jgi:hypothetical protein
VIEAEATERQRLADLLSEMDRSAGESLEEMMAVPAQRDRLKALALAWMRSQAGVIEAVTSQITHRAEGNGH